jgi:hypothetical protein
MQSKTGFKRERNRSIMEGELAMNTRHDNLARPRAELKTNPHDSRPNLFGGD